MSAPSPGLKTLRRGAPHAVFHAAAGLEASFFAGTSLALQATDAEPHPNYHRIRLSPVLAGEQTLDEIVLNPLGWYEEHGITLHLGKTVTEIDRVPVEVWGHTLRVYPIYLAEDFKGPQ